MPRRTRRHRPRDGILGAGDAAAQSVEVRLLFADSAAFRAHIAEELAWHSDWEARLRAGCPRIDELLRDKAPLMSPAMLRPFFEAYALVADALRDAPADIAAKELTNYALRLGRQRAAQGRLRSNESVSALLFVTARQMLADQGLLERRADLADRRHSMLAELREILDDMDRVEQIARQRFVERQRPRLHRIGRRKHGLVSPPLRGR